MQRIINVLLLLVIVVGVVQLVRKQRNLTIVQAEHSRLAQPYGLLEVKDKSKFLIKRVKTDDPKHFLWHCYCPTNVELEERSGFGRPKKCGSSTFVNDDTYLIRCRFDVRDGVLRAHIIERMGYGRRDFDRKPVLEFVNQHWNELELDVLATAADLTLDTTQVLNFLTIRIPESLRVDFTQQVGETLAKQYTEEPFFQMLYGTPEAFVSYDQEHTQSE
ncbi:hypothetical protein [Rubripirellula reticaptiva]|uniref:Uncharacterized protein n=1 Tax=Rubripirellula reticaptiva TaxID=2528013 RepID=A0A5C6EN74_9BACT|nr:hypothetical protein [Rubripirellula reticaptiva]TWU49101.1 hypothetical protein Poly59_37140 [Rubripirellula reticaptiva]